MLCVNVAHLGSDERPKPRAVRVIAMAERARKRRAPPSPRQVSAALQSMHVETRRARLAEPRAPAP